MGLLPFDGGSDAELLPPTGFDQGQCGTFVGKNVVDKPVDAQTHVVRVVEHGPVGGNGAKEFLEEGVTGNAFITGKRQKC